LVNQQQFLPKYWTLPMLTNFSRHALNPQSTEYKFVADKFYQSLTKLKNQHPIPAPPPIPVQPPPPSVLVPPVNNLPLSSFPPAFFQRMASIQTPINHNNNGSTMNQPPPPAHHTFGTLPYPMPIGANNMVQPVSLPPPLAPPLAPPPPPPPVPYLPQQIYRSVTPYTRSRNPHLVPMNNTIAPTRQSRTANHGINIPQIIQIERIQNQRWYKQYSAHECEFRQKLGKQTEEWLFHG